jgi:hypothetical protein
MPISRQRAIVRLLNMWCQRVIEDADYALRVTTADVLDPDVVDRVMRDDLFAEFDLDLRIDNIAHRDRKRQRDQELARAGTTVWLWSRWPAPSSPISCTPSPGGTTR